MSDEYVNFFTSPLTRPILCVGDIMLDIFVQGSVSRISPEAPIPVFRYLHEYPLLGGVGNVVRNLESLAIPSILIGLLGDDDAAETLESLIHSSPFITPDLLKCKHFKTTQKTRFIAGTHQLLRVDKELPEALLPIHSKTLKEKILKVLSQIKVMILSDYSKGVLSKDLLIPLIQEARNQNKIIIVDPKGKDYSRYSGASILTPNRQELHVATDLPTNTHEECIIAAQKIRTSYNIESVLVTRGGQGMTLVTETTTSHFPATALEVFDVSGAGDTVVAVLAAGLNTGIPLETAVQISNTAGGVVVGKVGTAAIEKQELQDVLFSKSSLPSQKILSLSQALDLRMKWQRRGLKVGFTNGCFDLLHSGHLHILRESKAQCDRLFVALNNDSSIKKLKGETRPIQTEDCRALVLASLEMVDGIILFEDETPYTLITTLKPDVLIKGADYTVETVVGSSEVMSYGGKVHLVNLIPDKSTSHLVKKMTS